MNFFINDLIKIRGTEYIVIGMIKYRNHTDNEMWTEYRLRSPAGGVEKWLSVDDTYKEYSISEMTSDTDIGSYHRVDKGRQEVVERSGQVDVDIGETASFEEYEDSTEEYTFSVEKWSDGTEYSRGYYLDPEEIVKTGGNTNYYSADSTNYNYNNTTTKTRKKKSIVPFVILIFSGFFILPNFLKIFSSNTKIDSHLEKSSDYTYETSITGSKKQKADVYKSKLTIDATAKDIISAVDGKTESVQQNTEDDDKSIAILTSNEYCLVYEAENNDVLVQISDRKYAYYSDESPYRSTRYTRRYYRRFYYSRGYVSDCSHYSKEDSPYRNFSDSDITSNTSDKYSSYASSIRQSSTSTRSTAGGGTNYGK